MISTTESSVRVSPNDVHDHLRGHMLVDGFPLVMDLEKSQGAYLYDSLRGRALLDLFTCFSTCPLGYNHPQLDTPEFRERILPAALNKPANSDLYTTQMAEFVDTFARTLPTALNQRLFFISGGALAVENTLKAAFDWKVRKNMAAGKGEKGSQVIHFQQAFHGRSGYTLSLTNTADPKKYQYFPRFDWPRVSNPHLRFPVTPQILEEVEAAEARALDEIKQALTDNPDDIAALLIEPIQGEGGDNHFRREFLQQLRELADEAEFLLAFDEVQTGFGTTGKWWAFEHFDVIPDLLAFGKKAQVCGICASSRLDEIDSVFKVSSRINSTWGGNLADMVRSQRYVEIIESEDLLTNATEVGGHILAGFHKLAELYPGKVTNGRGRGMFVAFDLPDGETRDLTLKAMLDADVLGLASGERSIRFRPSLALTQGEADEGLDRLTRALATLL